MHRRLPARRLHRRLAALALAALVVTATACLPYRTRLDIVGTGDRFVDSTRGTPATCQHGPLGSRDLPVLYRYPTNGAGPFPLLVFAHGFGVDPMFYATLLADLTAGGYVVAAPTFPVSGPGPCPSRADFAGQALDVGAVITHVLSGASPVSRLVDPYRIGVVGHSDGALTVGAMAHVAGLDDDRVRAYVALSGGIPGGLGGFVDNRAAVLAVNGQNDPYNNPFYSRDLYNRSTGARALLVTTGGTHTSPYFGNEDPSPATRDAILDFLDAFVQDDPGARPRFVINAQAAGATAVDGW